MEELRAKVNECALRLGTSNSVTLMYSQQLDQFIVEEQLKLMRGENNEG